jgi:TonB family protein
VRVIGTRGRVTIAAVAMAGLVVAACRPTESVLQRGNSTPVQVAVDHRVPVRLSGESPVMPAAARRAGQRGPVLLEVRIDEAGAVTVQKVVSGHALLNDAAIRAAGQWRYAPFIVDGRATAITQTVLVNFVDR